MGKCRDCRKFRDISAQSGAFAGGGMGGAGGDMGGVGGGRRLTRASAREVPERDNPVTARLSAVDWASVREYHPKAEPSMLERRHLVMPSGLVSSDGKVAR